MSDHNQSHLLVVDDDERIRSLLQKFLIRQGFWVTGARDAEHARGILSGLEFDLIVLDVMMPGEDGISFTRSLRDQVLTTPILLLTAKGETEDRIAGLEAGADDYLAKPFEPKELLLRINAICAVCLLICLRLSSQRSLIWGLSGIILNAAKCGAAKIRCG